jgi:GntR family transcriptional repressor for pyruvate dehydrogenase complex
MMSSPDPDGNDSGAVLLGRRSRPRSRGEQLADGIRDSISARKLSAGDFFGTLESIREETGFARTTVSEAVNLLRDRGVLVVKPGRHGGLFVAKTTPLVRLRHTLMTFDGDPASAADAIELRESLEELIAVKATLHRTDADIRDLEGILIRMRAAETWDGFMQTNWELHRRIAAICPNSMARAVYESTLGFLVGGRAQQDGEVDETYWGARVRIHEGIVEAIHSGDTAKTATAVAAHRA